MTLTLRPYQKRLLARCEEQKRGFLQLPPGTGKTAIMLRFALKHSPTLVVAPPRVAANVWKRQAAVWAPELRVEEYLGTPAKRNQAIRRDHDLLVTHYDLLEKCLAEIKILGLTYRTLVLDESGAFRHVTSKRFGQLQPWFERFKSVFCLNGTPCEQSGALDLWAQVYAVDLGESLGKSHLGFCYKYAYLDQWLRWQWRPGKDPAEVAAKIRHLCMTIEPEEHPELPELTEIVERIPVPKEARRWMDDVVQETLRQHYDGVDLAAQQKAIQAASGFVYHNKMGEYTFAYPFKLEALQERLEALRGFPTLVVYQHKAVERQLRAWAYNKGVSYAEFRDEPIEKLCTREVVSIHPASAGHGVDGLQGHFRYMVIFQPDWSGSRTEQTIKRIHRPGVAGDVTVYWMVSEGTIEERMVAKAQGLRERLTLEDIT